MTKTSSTDNIIPFPAIPEAPRISGDEHPPPIARRKLTSADRRRSRVAKIDHFVECFADPLNLRLSMEILHEHDGDGGRHCDFPAWVYTGMISAVTVMGSLSEVAACLESNRTWQMICTAVEDIAHEFEMTEILTHPRYGIGRLKQRTMGPSRGQFYFFRKTRLSADNENLLRQLATRLIIQRVRSFHMAKPQDEHRFNQLHRSRCLIIDGKVTNSPLRTLKEERVNKLTGEILPVRQDDARALYGEGGEEGRAWGSKWVNTIIADTLSNVRLALPAIYVPQGSGHSEADYFVTQLESLVPLFNDGIDAVIADGALNGVHIEKIQTRLGILVVSPPKLASKRNRKVTDRTTGTSYLARALPVDRKHPGYAWACHGRGLVAGGGTVWTTSTNVDGRVVQTPVTRGQIKRQKTKDGYAFSVHLTIEACPHCRSAHSWWESLTAKKTDGTFNRAHYLRAYTPLDQAQWRRVYGMRPDVESNNNQIEHAWYGHRIPAWGRDNQALVMLGFALATATKARIVYHRYLASQTPQVA